MSVSSIHCMHGSNMTGMLTRAHWNAAGTTNVALVECTMTLMYSIVLHIHCIHVATHVSTVYSTVLHIHCIHVATHVSTVYSTVLHIHCIHVATAVSTVYSTVLHIHCIHVATHVPLQSVCGES